MDFTTWLPVVAALGTGLGVGLAEGKRYLASRAGKKNGKHVGVDMSSDPPQLLNPRLTKSGRWPGLCELCSEHSVIVEHNKTALHLAQQLQASVSSAASAASMASAAAMRIEQKVHDDGEQTRGAIKELADKMGDLREWKGKIEGDVGHLDGQVMALWSSVRDSRDGRTP